MELPGTHGDSTVHGKKVTPPPHGKTTPYYPAAASRYFRVYITDTSDANFCSIAEIEFLDGADASIAGGTATASSQFSGTYSADKARDGSVGTWWATDTGQKAPCWWAIDFGSTKTAKKVRLTPVSGSPTHMPTQLEVQTSVDGVTWTDAPNITPSLPWVDNVAQTFNL